MQSAAFARSSHSITTHGRMAMSFKRCRVPSIAMRKVVRVLTALLFFGVLLGAGIAWWAYSWLHGEIANLQAPVTYEVPRGASLRSVARELRQRGVIERPQVWIAAARISGKAGALKAGEYRIDPGLTPLGVLRVLSSGQVILHGVTFIEGSRFIDMLAQLK